MSADEALARAKNVGWGPSLPKGDAEIDYSDIPPQDFSGPDVVRGKYRELALAASGFVQLDADVRQGFPDAQSVNEALRAILRRRRAP